MAMPAVETRPWTRAEVIALIDASPLQTPRYELVDGELFVTSSPRPLHQIAVRELVIALARYLEEARVGEVLNSPSDVKLEDETLTQPDVYVVPDDEAVRIRREPTVERLLLAVEVISPSSARGDRGKKRLLFQRRVSEYWIVDLDARIFERWRPGDERPEILRERVDWRPTGASVPFVLDLSRFFARVFRET